jgi:hypothetical protein
MFRRLEPMTHCTPKSLGITKDHVMLELIGVVLINMKLQYNLSWSSTN